jgi:RNase H-fold protein (predicted Holliday junction resolvase)
MKSENQKILEKVLKFKEKLKNIFPEINFYLIDERFTTSIVDNSF